MVIGIPKEMKDHEFRVALTPDAVHQLATRGHAVLVESGAGVGSGFPDSEFEEAGGRMISSKKELFEKASFIVKVKEPQPEEYGFLLPHHTLFTYLHLAASKKLTEALLDIGCTAIAYETTESPEGRFPMLYPMSEIAGRLSIQIGAHYLEKLHGGKGTLLAGLPGVEAGHVVILGSGTVGTAATRIAVGMGARVTVISLDLDALKRLDDRYRGRIRTLASHQIRLEKFINDADLIIGAVMLPGARTPRLISRAMVNQLKPGSVLVDVAVDQGGCAETTHPTTHSQPVYLVNDVVHYCVTNIPALVPRTATLALTNATLPFIVRLAEEGLDQALQSHPGLAQGVNVKKGKLTCRAVAEAHGLPYQPFSRVS